MRKHLLLLLCLVSSLMALAERGTCGPNLTWELEGGILVISGTGAMTNYSSISDVPWYSSRSTISRVVINEGVTSIGDRAFRECSGLTSITIPNSVTSIGNSAFYGCSSLTSITIPNSVTSIGNDAFYGCSGLTSITIPNSVTSIGRFAFEACSGLTSVNITDLASWCNIDFGSLSANPTEYAHKLVLNGAEIKDLVIPEEVTKVKNFAFYNCSGLTSVTIPNSVKNIGYQTFINCSSLTSITIPNSVTSIGEYAFSGCRSLSSICIPNSVTSIGGYAFEYCGSLSTVNVLATTPPTCGSNLLRNAGTTTIHVYEGLADVYRASSDWNIYNIEDDIPPILVTSLTLDASRYACAIGQRCMPQVVTYMPEDATYKQVTWSSSDSSTLAINPSTGACIGVKEGIVTITATAKDSGHATATATVYVGTYPEDVVTISASSDNIEYGTVSGGGVFLPNATVTLTAKAATGFEFVRWSDGSTQNPYVLNVTENKELIAYFQPAIVRTVQSVTQASTFSPNKWYMITQSRNGESAAYENMETSEICRAASGTKVTVGDNYENIKNYLARFVPTTISNIYHIQMATGNYWSTTDRTEYFPSGIQIYTTSDIATAGNYFVYNIQNTQSHFAINLTTDHSTYGLILDNNGAGSNASFWGTGKVNSLNGNNDWKFYEVELPVVIRTACNPEEGKVSGMGAYRIGTQVSLNATPNDGYSFVRWSDGSTQNPYVFTATTDKSIVAEFQSNNIKLTDGTPFCQSTDMRCSTLTYTRTFSEKNAGHWQAWYVPFDLNPTEYADDFTFARIYMMAYVNPNTHALVADPTQGELSVVLKYLEDGELVQAGTPYVIKARQAGEQTFESVDGVLHAATENHTVASSTTSEIFTFSGNYESVTCPAGWYAIAASGGFIAAEGKTLNPYRWHFEVTPTGYGSSVDPSTVANARMYVMDEDNRLLTSVMNMQAQADSYRTYDMQGRLLKGRGAQHGISIHNGRKYVR